MEQPDWTDLPPELVRLVSKNLFSMSDFIRLRASCKAWRDSLSPLSDLPPLLPCLILHRGRDTNDQYANLGPSLSIYDLSDSTTHVLPDLPAIQGKRICGSSHGWLVLEDRERHDPEAERQSQREVSLLNPITKELISLPSLSVPPNVLFPGDATAKGAAMQTDLVFCIKKAILSSNPHGHGICFVMALLEVGTIWETAFCRIGDDCWTTVFVRGTNAPVSPVFDIGYHNNRFYMICGNGNAWICNISDSTLNRVPSTFVDGNPLVSVCTVEGRGAEHRFMICFMPYLGGSVTRRMLSESEEGQQQSSSSSSSWVVVNQEQYSDSIIFLAGFFHCIAIPAADHVRRDGWGGGSRCDLYHVAAGPTNGPGQDRPYTWRIVRTAIHGNIAAVIAAGNPNGSVETNNYRRLLERPYFLWFTPTFN